MFVPSRHRGVETLDDPSQHPALAVRSLQDVVKANQLFGGCRAVLGEVRKVLINMPGRETVLLDVGTGAGDIPAAARRTAHALGASLTTIGLELEPFLARVAKPACGNVVSGNALCLPFADRSVDIVTCSQVLHHFDGDDALLLLRECTRVARRVVVVADLRRSWLAIVGLWVASFVLRFHPVSRADGIVSIRRGFTISELELLVKMAVRGVPEVRYRPGWRITAVWKPPEKNST